MFSIIHTSKRTWMLKKKKGGLFFLLIFRLSVRLHYELHQWQCHPSRNWCHPVHLIKQVILWTRCVFCSAARIRQGREQKAVNCTRKGNRLDECLPVQIHKVMTATEYLKCCLGQDWEPNTGDPQHTLKWVSSSVNLRSAHKALINSASFTMCGYAKLKEEPWKQSHKILSDPQHYC